MNEIEILKKKIADLEAWKRSMEASHSIPLNIDQALVGRKFLKNTSTSSILDVVSGGTGNSTLTGIVVGNGTSPLSTVTPIAGQGSFFVASSSGGAVTTEVNYNTGIISSIT